MALPGDGETTPTTITGLFDSFPIGRSTSIGVSNGFWTGGYGATQEGVALLTNAQLYDNAGGTVGAVQLVVRIPLDSITYVV